MTSKSTVSAVSALSVHKVEYAVQKLRPVMLPPRSNASLSVKTSVEANPKFRRCISKGLNNVNASFHESTKMRKTKDIKRENESHCLRSCDWKIASQEWSQGDVTRSKTLRQNKTSLRKTKFVFNRHQSLPVGINKTLHSASGIKALNTLKNPRINSASASRNWSIMNATFTDSEEESKINTSEGDYATNAFTNRTSKQLAPRNRQKNILKTETRSTILPSDKLSILSHNEHSKSYEISKLRNCDQQCELHRASVKSSVIKVKSFRQYQVKQKYRRRSLYLKPFGLFFRRTSSNTATDLHFDLTSTVKCTKEESFLTKKHLPISNDLSSSYQKNIVDLSPGKNKSLSLLKNLTLKKYASTRECGTSAHIAKGCYPSIYRSNFMYQWPQSKAYGKKTVCLCAASNNKHVDGKRLLEHGHCKNHRQSEKQNYKNESTQDLELSCPFKSKASICSGLYAMPKNKLRSDQNISLRTCQINSPRYKERIYKTDPQTIFECSFKENCDDIKTDCLRYYANRSRTKNGATNIRSSFNVRVDVSNDHTRTPGLNLSKNREHKNEPIVGFDTVSFQKKGITALNKILKSSSVFHIKPMYTKLLPISSTRKKETKLLKVEAVSHKITVNKRDQNKYFSTDLIDKQIPGDKSKTSEVENDEHNSFLKRCFRFIFHKRTKNGLAETDYKQKYKTSDEKNTNFDDADLTMKKYCLLKSKDMNQIKNSDALRNRKIAICDSNNMKKQDTSYSAKTMFESLADCTHSFGTDPAEKRIVKYETPNYQKLRNRVYSNLNFNVEFYEDAAPLNFHKPDELNTKLKRQVMRRRMSSHNLHNQGVHKNDMVNPAIMSLLHNTKYTYKKSETSNAEHRKRKTYTDVFNFKPYNCDDTLALYEHRNKNFKATSSVILLKKINQDTTENKTSLKKYQQTEPTKLSVKQSQTICLQQTHKCAKHSKNQNIKSYVPIKQSMENQKHKVKCPRNSELLKRPVESCSKSTGSTYNTSEKVSSNNLSMLKLNITGRSKSRLLISCLSPKPRKKYNDFIKTSSAKIKTKKSSTKSQERRNEITAAYCHITYDRAGNVICERDTTCEPQCEWITKKGKKVKAKAHVIEDFCPFEDGHFMIQPCVMKTKEHNNEVKKIKNKISVKANLLKKCLDKKKCDCVCSKGDARTKEKNILNTNIKPKLSIEVDCDKMNIKNRDQVLQRVMKIKEQEINELGEGQGRTNPPCCCTGSQPKSLLCTSCTNIPHRPILKQTLTMKSMENEPLLEIKMDSDSNILNRKELMDRIKKMKNSGNKIKYSNTGPKVDKIAYKVKNKLTAKNVCVCKNEVCSQDSEEEHRKKAKKEEKEKPCVCGAPSCERFSIQRLVKEGKLSKKDGRIILKMINKQEIMKRKEEARRQKERLLNERKKIKEKHLKQTKKKKVEKKKPNKAKKAKKPKKITAKLAQKGKLTKQELKGLPKEEKELLEMSLKKQSVAQKENRKIKIAIQRQKIEDAERKEKEELQERQTAAGLEMKFKRQMLADERKEKKDLRKKLFSEKIKLAKDKRMKNLATQKRKKQIQIKKQKDKLKERIEDEELKKHKEIQKIVLAEKERIHNEQQKRKKKKEKRKNEKLLIKKRKTQLKLKLLKDKKKRAAILKKKKEKEKKIKMKKIRKENKRFLKEMGKIAEVERKKQMKEAEKKRQLKLKRHEFMRAEIKKYKDADDRYLVVESLKEAGACCVKYTGKFFDYLSYSARHPMLTYKKMRRAYLQPVQVATEVQKSWSESEVHDIANRIEAKILALDRLHPIGKKLYQKPKKKRLPKRKFKKRKRNRRAPMDFGCSLYMASLRRKPYFFLYWMCPWFYPHLISMLKVLRQIADLGLFILAAFAWSPFILLWELFRTIMCCGLCTA